jgi:hypothetical protein
VQVVDQDNMGEAIQILQPDKVLWVYLDCTGGAMATGRLDGHVFQVGEGGVDDADRLVGDIQLIILCIKPAAVG